MTSANRLAECVKPVVEQLEGRTLMSITVSPLFTDSEGHLVLKIRGDSKNDTLLVVDDPINGQVDIVRNGVPDTIFYPGGANSGLGGEIETFDIDLGGGKDRLTFETGTPGGPSYTTAFRSIHLDGDTGDDTIVATFAGGMVSGSDITIDIDGDSGNDNTTVSFDYLRDSKLDVGLSDGEGNDTSLVTLPNVLSSDGFVLPNYASAVFFDAETGNGKNTLSVNAQSTMEYDSFMDIDIKGGNSTGSSYDTINLDFDNTTVEGKLFVVVNANAGDDKINTKLDNLYVETFHDSGAPYYDDIVNSPTATFLINGNDGKDTLTQTATVGGMYLDENAFLSISLKGGNGDDKINSNLTGPIDVSVGAQLVLNIDGQNNNDNIQTFLNFDDKLGTGGGMATIQVLGGQNTDTMVALLTDNSSSGLLTGPGAFGVLFDGQSGTDKINIQSVNLLVAPAIRNFEGPNTVIILP